MNHRAAIITIVAAAILDALGGLAFAATEHISPQLGLYWAVATATTVGYGDVAPHTPLGHLIAVAVMLTVVPLFAATFSLFAATLSAKHVSSKLLPHIRASRRITADIYRDRTGHDHPAAEPRENDG